MKIETTEKEFRRLFAARGLPNTSGVVADLLGLEFLEEPEPSLEERHPRPWKVEKVLGAVRDIPRVVDAGGCAVAFGLGDIKHPVVAAWNREPLLLEIAEAAEEAYRSWLLMNGTQEAHDKLGSLLHRLRLELREEKS